MPRRYSLAVLQKVGLTERALAQLVLKHEAVNDFQGFFATHLKFVQF